jgi:type VI secretion system protein ImpH
MAQAPFDYDFYRAVRLIENHFTDRPRVGYSEKLDDDFLRFRQNPSLAFAPSTIESIMPEGGAAAAIQVFVRFLGLLGPNGPLPTHVTSFVQDRLMNAQDPAMARFLDIFNHRVITLFYRAWASAQKSVDFDRPEGRFIDYIGGLCGIGMKSLRNLDDVPDRAKLYFSGRLACQTRNAEGLGAILEDFFGTPTRIIEFVGTWMTIPEANRCRLGESPETGVLGSTAIAGSRKYEGQMKFRIRMGPMKLARLQALVPNGRPFKRIKDWVLNYIGYEYLWDLQCVVEAAEVKTACLGKMGQLGWTCWTISKPATEDADDPIFDPQCAG